MFDIKMCGSSLALGIPRWFGNRSSDSLVRLEIHPDLDGNRNWRGYALFFVYEIHEHQNSTPSEFKPRAPYHQFICHFETNEGLLEVPLNFGERE